MSRLNALRVSPADDRRNPPRRYCNWLQGLVDKELRRQYEHDNITVKSHELANLHAHQLHEQGYDPYNTLDRLTPWLRAVETMKPSTPSTRLW